MKELIRLVEKMKEPDRFLTRLIVLGWGVVGTFGVAALVNALRWW